MFLVIATPLHSLQLCSATKISKRSGHPERRGATPAKAYSLYPAATYEAGHGKPRKEGAATEPVGPETAGVQVLPTARVIVEAFSFLTSYSFRRASLKRVSVGLHSHVLLHLDKKPGYFNKCHRRAGVAKEPAGKVVLISTLESSSRGKNLQPQSAGFTAMGPRGKTEKSVEVAPSLATVVKA